MKVPRDFVVKMYSGGLKSEKCTFSKKLVAEGMPEWRVRCTPRGLYDRASPHRRGWEC